MKRQFAVVGVALFLLMGLLVACGGGDAQEAQPVATATSAPATESPAAAPTSTPTSAPESQADAAATEETSADTAARVSDIRTFAIDPEQSQARFFVDEVLLGVPTTVEGVTNLVSGEIMVDIANPASTTIGPIVIDARDLKTDRDLRNRAIRRFILQSTRDEYQYITFTPTSIDGLPDQAAPGDTFTFEVTGDLQIRDITSPVTFSIELTADSDTQFSGLTTTTVMRSDFELTIPNAPGVADVSEDVRLELAFTAVAQ